MPAVTHVATLTTHSTVLDEGHLASVAAVLPGVEPARWLAPGVAADLPFAPEPGSGNPRWSEAARRALAGAPVDVVVQGTAGRRKRLLVADMDGTVIPQECIDELAILARQGEAVAALTRASVRGEADFADSLRRRVALLAGLTSRDIDRVAASLTLDPGAAVLVATMRAHGAVTVLASGGFTHFTGVIVDRVGFDRHHGNELEFADGRLAGTLREPILGPAGKADLLRALRDELRLAPEETLAVGDGANDRPMLAEAGLGVAFRAEPVVAEAARARIDHSDLSALLYLQGYARHEFVEGSAAR